MFRRISSSGARRGPSERSSAGDTPSTSSAPTVQRHLRELRAVERPLHLNRRHVVQEEPRQRDAPDVVVSCRRHRGIHLARQRRECPNDRHGVLQRADLFQERRRVGGGKAVDGQSAPAPGRRCSPPRSSDAHLAFDRRALRRSDPVRPHTALRAAPAGSPSRPASSSRSASEKPDTGTPSACATTSLTRSMARHTAGWRSHNANLTGAAGDALGAPGSDDTSATRTNVVRAAVTRAPALSSASIPRLDDVVAGGERRDARLR